MDVVGPKGYRFILTITDYVSKWVEAIPLREVKISNVIKFIKHHVVYGFGVPRRIVQDNGVSQAFLKILQKVQDPECVFNGILSSC